jgi:hypothetical protein
VIGVLTGFGAVAAVFAISQTTASTPMQLVLLSIVGLLTLLCGSVVYIARQLHVYLVLIPYRERLRGEARP